MKITDSDTIKNSETNLIDGLIGDLDWQVIETLLKEKYHLRLHDDVEYKSGDIIVHDRKIAYKLDFDVRVTLSLYVGRDGECFDIKASGSQDDDEPRDIPPVSSFGASSQAAGEEEERPLPDLNRLRHVRNNEEMASQLVDIISEIND